MENHTLRSARFTNNIRSTIVAEWVDDNDPNIIRESYMTVDENSVKFKKLLEIYTLDQIEEATVEYGKLMQKRITDFHQQLIDGGQVSTSAVQENSDNTNYDMLFDFMFKFNPEYHDEGLFNMKLAVFEIEEISDCEDSELKESIRTAETPIELMNIVSNSGLINQAENKFGSDPDSGSA